MKLWIVECKGKFLAKSKVYAAGRQEAMAKVKDKVAEHVYNFLQPEKKCQPFDKEPTLTMPEVVAALNRCTWTAEVHPEGILQLDWDIQK